MKTRGSQDEMSSNQSDLSNCRIFNFQSFFLCHTPRLTQKHAKHSYPIRFGSKGELTVCTFSFLPPSIWIYLSSPWLLGIFWQIVPSISALVIPHWNQKELCVVWSLKKCGHWKSVVGSLVNLRSQSVRQSIFFIFTKWKRTTTIYKCLSSLFSIKKQEKIANESNSETKWTPSKS